MRGVEVVTTWIGAIERVPETGYRPVEDYETLPPRVRGDSTMWAAEFLQDGASPYAPGANVRWSVHLADADTPDILRCRYRAAGYDLDIAETINFMLIRLAGQPKVTELPPPVRAAAVRAAAEAILKLREDERAWNFQLPAEIADGVLFSTNPELDPLDLPSWKDRADGGVRHRALFFLCYKKLFDLSGYRDVQHWFR